MEDWEILRQHSKRMDAIIRLKTSLRTAACPQKWIEEHKGTTRVEVLQHLSGST